MSERSATSLAASARRVTVLTGAGVSTDSGISHFRGPDGVLRSGTVFFGRPLARTCSGGASCDDIAATVVRKPVGEALPRLLANPVP